MHVGPKNERTPTKTLNSIIRLSERLVSGVSLRASEIGSVAAENMSLPETCHGEVTWNSSSPNPVWSSVDSSTERAHEQTNRT